MISIRSLIAICYKFLGPSIHLLWIELNYRYVDFFVTIQILQLLNFKFIYKLLIDFKTKKKKTRKYIFE